MTNSEHTFRDAGPGELLKDVLRISPAPNPSREAFVTVFNLVVVGALLALLQPEPVAAVAVAVVFVLFTAGRWLAGTRKWGRRV
jgi:hypothetical protein